MPMTYQVPSAVQADRRGEWKDYDPDRDDYDPCTAVLLPPPADANELFRRQVIHLQSRIRKGGKEKVLAHYLKVVEEMERSMNPDTKEVMVVTQFKKEFCHKRTTSAASTAAPEGPEQVDDLEEDHEDEEEEADIPLEGAHVATTRAFTKKSLPGHPNMPKSGGAPLTFARLHVAQQMHPGAMPQLAPVFAAPVRAAPVHLRPL